MNSKTCSLFLIDDDDLFRESIRVRLERDGVRVDAAATDSMALSAASKWLGVII